MKTREQVEAIMQTIPVEWRQRWCGGEYGACGCLGCVQIGNRVVMYEEATGKTFWGDPEYIRESEIPAHIYEKYKITKEEWQHWKSPPASKEQTGGAVSVCVYCNLGDTWFRHDPPWKPQDYPPWPMTVPLPALPPLFDWTLEKLREYHRLLKEVKEMEQARVPMRAEQGRLHQAI